jgi:hypothetical protein
MEPTAAAIRNPPTHATDMNLHKKIMTTSS